MEPITKVRSKVAPHPFNDVDTDQIIPKQFLKRVERTGFGEFLFWDWRDAEGYRLHHPEHEGAEILIAGRNFGCGSSREHAPWALQDFGFRVIIAESFADIFRTNCTKIGLLPVTLSESEVADLLHLATASPGVRATVDLELQLVQTSEGHEIPFAIEPGVKERLLNGWDDIALSLLQAGAISAYESDREREGPVTTPFA